MSNRDDLDAAKAQLMLMMSDSMITAAAKKFANMRLIVAPAGIIGAPGGDSDEESNPAFAIADGISLEGVIEEVIRVGGRGVDVYGLVHISQDDVAKMIAEVDAMRSASVVINALQKAFKAYEGAEDGVDMDLIRAVEKIAASAMGGNDDAEDDE